MVPQIERARPPYLQVADHLRGLIVRGELKAGERVPSERQLAEEWGISRATATKAMASLRLEGLVESHAGMGTVVSASPVYRRVGDRYATVRRTGRIYTTGEYAKITSAETMAAPDEVAEALDLGAGGSAIRRHRVTYLGDSPVACSTSWFDAALAESCPRLLEVGRIVQGTAAYVEEMTGRRMSAARDRIAARLASDEEVEELGLKRPAAVLETRHTVWDVEGHALSFEVGIAPPERWTSYEYDVP